MEAVQPLDLRGDGVDGGGGGGRRGGSLRRQERMQGAIDDDDGGGVGIPAARRIDAGIFAAHIQCSASNLIVLVRKRLPAPLHFLSLWGVVVRPAPGGVGGAPATVWPSYQASHFPALRLVSCAVGLKIRPPCTAVRPK